MTGPLSVTMFVMSGWALSFLLLAHRKYVAHGLTMLAAIVTDTALTIYLVIGAHALHKFVGTEEVQAIKWLLWFHGFVATVMLVCYALLLHNALPLLWHRMRGSEHRSRSRALVRHRKIGVWTFATYFITALTCPGGPVEWLCRWLG